MLKFLIIFSLVGLSGCGVTTQIKDQDNSHDPHGVYKTIPSKYQEAVAKAEIFGTEIYLQDIAAWVVTDFLADKGVIGKDQRLQGWITEHADDEMKSGRMRVTFLGEINNNLKGLYQVETQLGEVFEETYRHPAEGIPLSKNQISMFRARETALSSGFKRCANTYNTAVIPYRDDHTAYNVVYLLAGTFTSGEVMAGGNYRVVLNDAGDEIIESVSLSKSCIVLQKRDKIVALNLSHIVEPTPNAVHVFLSLLHQVPIYILTTENDIFWEVDGNNISMVKGD